MVDNTQPMRVLFLSAEAAPLIKAGGLGDVAGSLPPALAKLQNGSGQTVDIRVAMPYYPVLKKKDLDVQPVCKVKVAKQGKFVHGVAYRTTLNGLVTYLIDGEPFDNDVPIYSNRPDVDGDKFIFFSLACLDLIEKLDWKPEILHANDWHTAAAIYSNRVNAPGRSPNNLKSVLTIHNLPFMGKEAETAMTEYGLPCAVDYNLPRWATLFPLPTGMVAADRIVAVSPSYAKEVLTPEFGCGLQDFLTQNQGKLTGILNGLDTTAWNPQTDPTIVNKFTSMTLEKRVANKTALQAEVELQVDPSIPVLAIISRLDQQKGIDIALDGLRQLVQHDWQLVLLGKGDNVLEAAAYSLEAQFPDRVRARIEFNGDLAHRMYSAADMILMPSRYEPCGLAQMIAMRYGCIPVARATGGLIDTINDDPSGQHSTGFLFSQPNPDSFNIALRRALYAFQLQESWREMQIRGMEIDVGWAISAQKYADLYTEILAT